MTVTATLTQHSLISTRSSTAGDGTGHGADTLQYAVDAAGNLWATWLDDSPQPFPTSWGGNDFGRNVHVEKSTDGGQTWTEIAAFSCGHESGYLLCQQGRAKLVSYPGGLPTLWDSQTNTSVAIPGNWQTTVGSGGEMNGWWYGGVGVGADGTVFMARAVVNAQQPYNKPCQYQCTTIKPDGTFGQFWTTAPLADGRVGYGNVFPQPDGSALMVGMLALDGAEAGYSAAAYVWTDPVLLKFDPAAGTVSVVTYLYHGKPMANGDPPHVIVADGLALPGGDMAVVYSGQDGDYPNWFATVARVTAAGTVKWSVPVPFAYGNIARLSTLDDGTLVISNLFPTYPAPGPQVPSFAYATIDPATGEMSAPAYLGIPASVTPMDESADTQNLFSLNPRGGSAAQTNRVWVKGSVGPGATEHLWRFDLTPGNSPTPTPNPDPNAQAIAALQADVAALKAWARAIQQAGAAPVIA